MARVTIAELQAENEKRGVEGTPDQISGPFKDLYDATRPKKKRNRPNHLIIEGLQIKLDNARKELQDCKQGAVIGMALCSILSFVMGVVAGLWL